MKINNSLFLKILSFCLMLITAIGSCICCGFLFRMVYEIEVYKPYYRNTAPYESKIMNSVDLINRYYRFLDKANSGTDLSSDDKQVMEELKCSLYPPAGSNIVWALLDSSGNALLSNLDQTNSQTLEQIASLSDKHYEQIQDEDKYVVIGLRSNLPIEDEYSHGMDAFNEAKKWFAALIIMSSIGALVSIVLFSFLVAAAGHKNGVSGIALNAVDHIWLEIQFVLMFLFFGLGSWALLSGEPNAIEGYIVTGASLPGIFIPLFSVVRRAKAGVLYKTTLLHLIIQFIKTLFYHFHTISKLIGLMVLYGLLQVVSIIGISEKSTFFMLLWLFSNVSVMAILCIFFIQYDRILKATDRMVQGELNQEIDEKSLSFFARMARNLNSTGKAMSVAVERSMHSERMKTELITNVSHDIKTPLTSIISYVDLLRKTNITDSKALEFIDILERKSKRLGQLMIDLVEASKVTSGNISVNMEKINLSELVMQASGEFESRMEKRGIQLICAVPDKPVNIFADGRHMWRVLDNLFGNASKYALDGTRVYVDLIEFEQEVVLSVKNVSRDPLNMRPEDLMERFIRGDASRHTEGSGLGLSIARSLMELQHGKMDIFIDGDLFKVVLAFQKASVLDSTPDDEKKSPHSAEQDVSDKPE